MMEIFIGSFLIFLVSALALMLGFVVTTTSGCFTLNWNHNRRHLRKFIDQIREGYQVWCVRCFFTGCSPAIPHQTDELLAGN